MQNLTNTPTTQTNDKVSISLTAAEFWHDTPSTNRLILTWLLKCYLAIIAVCALPTLLFALLPSELLIAAPSQIDAKLYLFPLMIFSLIYNRIAELKNQDRL